MRPAGKRLAYLIVATLILASGGAARADAVTDWNARMEATVTTPPTNPIYQTRWGAIVQLAVSEAVNSIIGDYKPYLGALPLRPGASPEAAVIAAAHRALVTLRPASAGPPLNLDAARAADLAAIPDGPAKEYGIQAGEDAAAAMLLARANDGWDAVVSYTPGTQPGEFRPPAGASAFLPHWGQVTPFGLTSSAQFRLPAPPKLQTGKYANAYNEVKLLGSLDAPLSVRPQDRTDVARFYNATSPVSIWNQAARQASAAQGKTLSENSRTFALLGMAMVDAGIAGWDTKYHYNFWRPQAAIQAGDLDDNPLTDPDPTWRPLIPTPAHPSYASGHATVSGAARAVLEWAFDKKGHSITLSNPGLPGIVLHYGDWKHICDDIDDARIYGGIHFRFDQEAGAHQGRQVGKFLLRNYLRSSRGGEEFGDEE
jgi:hypothetical protein